MGPSLALLDMEHLPTNEPLPGLALVLCVTRVPCCCHLFLLDLTPLPRSARVFPCFPKIQQHLAWEEGETPCLGFREGVQKDEGGKDLLSRGMWDAAGSRGRENLFFNLAPLLSQPPGAVPGTQPLLPNSMDPTRQQGKPSRGGSSTDAPN